MISCLVFLLWIRFLPETVSAYIQDQTGISSLGNDCFSSQSGDISSGVFGQCKYLVGRSQIPVCLLNPVAESLGTNYPRNCKEIMEAGNRKSGVYQIKPRTSSKPFYVLCDMETKGGGWTHIQKRFDGSQDFYLPWRDYKFGFGDLRGEFWIGLENMYRMTAFDSNELLIEITDTNQYTSYARYTAFSIGAEKDGYKIKEVSGHSGSAKDAMSYHLNAKFTTYDVDHDTYVAGNCAKEYEGAWWYVRCYHSNLNGKYMSQQLSDQYNGHGLIWYWPGYLKDARNVNLAGSRILIREI